MMANPFLRQAYAGFRIARVVAGVSRSPSARPGSRSHHTVRLFGVDVADISTGQAVDRLIAWSREAPARTVIATNFDRIMRIRTDTQLRRCYGEADMVVADDLRAPAIAHATGPDLTLRLMGAAARQSRPVFLIGDGMARLHGAAQRLKTQHANLDIRGAYPLPPAFETDTSIHNDLVAMLRTVRPAIILLAHPAPRLELWSNRLARSVGHGVFVTVGAEWDSISVPTDETERIPAFVRRIGAARLWDALAAPVRRGGLAR